MITLTKEEIAYLQDSPKVMRSLMRWHADRIRLMDVLTNGNHDPVPGFNRIIEIGRDLASMEKPVCQPLKHR